MVVPEQLINVQPVNQDSSLPEPNVKLHANQTTLEMEPMDAENAQILVNHAQTPLHALHVLKLEINQSTEFVTLVFTHAQLVHHTNNVPDV